MFRRILIANRGEIAVRIIRACKELGIESVAVYSTADANSMHTKFADKSICIGPPQPTESYLNITNIISAAIVSECDAIHPGYGFLAENPLLEKESVENNIVFIGPPAKIIELAGNKSLAIRVMKENNIPIVPSSTKNIEDIDEAIKFCNILEYPVIIKAAFGGGGRGMRICNNENELKSFLPLAKSESESAFGNDDLYIEKYILKPRHIEFQILADNYGNIKCVGSRECSIQRKHQKLIEEAPAENLSKKTLESMTNYALKAAKALNYKNLGTFEFLVDQNEKFYFIEINTRLQVEHPVTEMVTGIDLVKEQIKISYGGKLDDKLTKSNPIKETFGHAIEYRINAEDPDNNFIPSPGKINNYFLPGGPGIRIDTFIHTNCIIPPYYDSLISKLIVWGADRDEAIARSIRALDEFKIEGIKTTIPFYKKILNNDNFRKGKINTNFIEEESLI